MRSNNDYAIFKLQRTSLYLYIGIDKGQGGKKEKIWIKWFIRCQPNKHAFSFTYLHASQIHESRE